MKNQEKIETQIASLQAANSRLTGICEAYEVVLGWLLKTSPYREAFASALLSPHANPMNSDNPDALRTEFAAQTLRRLQTFAAQTLEGQLPGSPAEGIGPGS